METYCKIKINNNITYKSKVCYSEGNVHIYNYINNNVIVSSKENMIINIYQKNKL